MNNEPVAWMGKDYDGLKTELYFDVERNKLPYRLYETATPLYTHPVKYCPSENNEAYEKGFIDGMAKQRDSKVQQMVEGYTHPVKEQSTNERIEMLKEMVEKIANPAGWIGYYEGKPATFLFKQEDVPRFLKNTDPVGSVIPLYTHPVKEQLTDEEIMGLSYMTSDNDPIAFVRAILRKAQEK